MQKNYSEKEYEKGIRPGPAKNSYRFASGILLLCVIMFIAEIGVTIACICLKKQISPTTWSVFVISVLGIVYSTSVLQDQKENEENTEDQSKDGSEDKTE